MLNTYEIDIEAKRQIVRNKIKAIGKMSKVFGMLREEKETIAELKNVMGVTSLPAGTLALGAEGIKQAISSFEQAKKADEENERLPPVRPGQTVAASVFGPIKSKSKNLDGANASSRRPTLSK
jgi:serine/threonine-protein phosphatase 2B catalytic subunit